MSLDIGYPLYSAAIVDESSFLVTGGGGEGNNGIPNKVSLLSIKSSSTANGKTEAKVAVEKEYEIPGKNDSPTGLVYSEGNVFVSCNSSSDSIKAGKNNHLRKFKVIDAEKKELLKPVEEVDIARFKDSVDYVKITKVSPDGKTLALVTSTIPSSIYLIDTESLKVKRTIEVENKQEVLDVALGRDGQIAYILQRRLVVFTKNAKHEEEELKYTHFSPSYQLAKLEFSTKPDTLIVGVNLRNKNGILLMESGIVPNVESPGEDSTLDKTINTSLKLKTRKARVILSKPAKFTSLAIQGDLIAVATNLNSIIISDTDSFKNFKTLEKVHSFAITSVKISKDLKYVISVSVSGTVNIFTIPDNLKVDYAQYLPILYILLIGILLRYANNYVQKNHKEQFDYFLDFMYGTGDFAEPDFEESDLLNSRVPETKIEVKTTYAVKQGDIVEELVESSAYVEQEIDGAFERGTQLI